MTDRSDYEFVVFDLDGTLVRLAVDWEAVAVDVRGTLEDLGVDPPEDLWGMLEAADGAGHREAVSEVICGYERGGAREGERLPTAGTVADVDGPVGVCSLNCEAACRLALEHHDVGEVDAVVGRDTLATEKPDPEPLLETVRRIGGDPEATLFVGDGERDATTAERAGTAFVYVSEWLRAYR